MILLKNKEEIAILREGGGILATVLKELVALAVPGASLAQLDQHARERLDSLDAVPTFLGYEPEGSSRPYPASLCASLNEVVVHGVPSDRILEEGDVLSLDMGVTYRGLITDSATTVIVGKYAPSPVQNLISVTKAALQDAIKMARIGNTLGDVGWAIEQRAKKGGVKVIRSLTGHGVGYELHEDPVIFNFGSRHEGITLKEGMVLALEPMFSLGSEEVVQCDDDSYATQDGSVSAHFEHTIAITRKGPQVLTS